MHRRIHGLLLVLFIAPALFSSPTNKAISLENVSHVFARSMLAAIKSCFSLERIKAITYTSARTLWNITKVGSVAIVLANIFMPTSWRQKLVERGLGRFVFAREALAPKSGNIDLRPSKEEIQGVELRPSVARRTPSPVTHSPVIH